MRFFSPIVLAIVAALFHAAVAKATEWHLEQPRTAWVLADGEHHAVWATPGARKATILDTRTGVRRAMTLLHGDEREHDGRTSGSRPVTRSSPATRRTPRASPALRWCLTCARSAPPLSRRFWTAGSGRRSGGAHWAARRGRLRWGGSFGWVLREPHEWRGRRAVIPVGAGPRPSRAAEGTPVPACRARRGLPDPAPVAGALVRIRRAPTPGRFPVGGRARELHREPHACARTPLPAGRARQPRSACSVRPPSASSGGGSARSAPKRSTPDRCRAS